MAVNAGITIRKSARLLQLLLVGLCGVALLQCSAEQSSNSDVRASGGADSEPLDSETCLARAQEFIASRGRHPRPDADPNKLLYFLHIPRTAGRTYHFCFLKQAHPPSRRCPKGYDTRLDERLQEACGLFSSHDDYSIVDMLPEDAAILTQLREPVGRILSSYEFAHIVASNAARDPKAAPAKADKVDTRNVWPWSLLIPFLEDKMRERFPAALEEAEALAKESNETWTLDPYNNPVTMPLLEFLNDPEVGDTVNNGATLQVLGLTSYSQWPAAAELRRCLPHSQPAREALLQLALERLDSFVHVGLFDRLEDSISSLAATLGIGLDGPAWGNGKKQRSNDGGQKISDEGAQASFSLWRSYHHCTEKARRKQKRRQASSFEKLQLPNTERLKYSSATRDALDPSILKLIREQNSMDVALYERGRQLLEARIEEHKRQGRWQSLRPKDEAEIKEIFRHEATRNRHRRGRSWSEQEKWNVAAESDASGDDHDGEPEDASMEGSGEDHDEL